MKRAITVLTAVMISILMGGSWAWATPTDPNEDHKVTICHRTGSADGGELKNGYNEITVDIASSGYVKGGHTGHEQVGNGPGPDIIPAYEAFAKVKGEWEPFSYPGLNLDFVFADGTTGAEFLANGCKTNTPQPVKATLWFDFIEPTCKSPEAWVDSEYDPTKIKAEIVDGKVEPGGTVTIVYSPKDGYVIDHPDVNDEGNVVVTHTFKDVPKDCEPVTEVAKPYDKFNVECGQISVVLGNGEKATRSVNYRIYVDSTKPTRVVNVAPGEAFERTYKFKEDSGKHSVLVTSEGEWVNQVFATTNCDKPEKPDNPNKPDKPEQPNKPEPKTPELAATGANLGLLGAALAAIVAGLGLIGASRLTRSA